MAGIIKTPWTSQAQQMVPSGGQTASFKSASDFLGGGGQGLADFARGLNQFGQAAFDIAIKERQDIQDMALLQDTQNLSLTLARIQDDIRTNNRGQLGVNAADIFMERAKKEVQALNSKWQGRGLRAQKFLAQHGGALIVSGYNSMLDHGRHQKEVWDASMMAGDQAEFYRLAAEPGTTTSQLRDYFFETLQPRMMDRARRQGLDPRAYSFKAETTLHKAVESNLAARLDEAIANGDQAGFERIMGEANRAWSWGRPAGSSAVALGWPKGAQGGGFTPPKGAVPFLGLVGEASAAYDVPPEIILAVMKAESGFRPGAVSPTGVRGLMQVTQRTYTDLGFTGDRADPRNSVMAGTKLLRQNFERYGNWDEALTAYNGGHGAVLGIRRGQWGELSAAKRREAANYTPTVLRNLRGMYGAAPAPAAGGDMADEEAGARTGGPPPAQEDEGAPAGPASAAAEAEQPDSMAADDLETKARTDEFDEETPGLDRGNYVDLNDDAAGGARFLSPARQLYYRAKWDRAQAARARAEEAALKKAGREAEKELIDMRYGLEGSQPFTADEVVLRRDLLSPADYEKWLKDAREGTPPPAHSNPETIINLTRMAVNGDPDLQDAADEELRAGRLTVPDYRAAINEGQQFRDPAIKRSLEEIRLKTGYSEMNPNPDAASSFIQAKKDFLDWLDSPAGKKAEDEGKLKMAGRIADNYRLVQADSLLTAPAPLFLVGSRTAPDIQKTLEATRAELEAGNLTEEEFAEQALRIKRLADILTQQEAAAEAAGAKQNGGRR